MELLIFGIFLYFCRLEISPKTRGRSKCRFVTFPVGTYEWGRQSKVRYLLDVRSKC
jgi:hypothetical protein